LKIALIKVRKDAYFPQKNWINELSGTLNEKFSKGFRYYDGIIFMGSMGILSRKIGDYIDSKFSDPCIVLLDEKLKYCVPVLSAHLGGGMILCEKIVAEFNCEKVLSTATDLHNLTGVDLFARKNNMIPDSKPGVLSLNSKLLNSGKISVTGFPSKMQLPEEYLITDENADMGYESGGKHLNLIKKNLVLGIGFHTDSETDEVIEQFNRCIPEEFRKRILTVTSHEKKWKSAVFHEFARRINANHTVKYDSETLNHAIDDLGIDCDNLVKKHMGVSHICKPSAYLSSNCGNEILTIKGKNTKFSLYEIKDDFWNSYKGYFETVPEVIL